MNDFVTLGRHYQEQGYRFLGSVNFSNEAARAYRTSKKTQMHQTGRCEYLVACHDLKVFVVIDSSD